jgi:hypothetical protein
MSTNSNVRCILENVPKVGYHIDNQYYFTPFAACLRSCLAYFGEDYTYPYILGMSGASFRLMWNTKNWDGGNVDIMLMAEDPVEPIRRAFESVGYAFEMLDQKSSDEGTFRTRIIESIRGNGQPVLAAGVIGPPEICIVTGYDENGVVLTGWNFFQERPHEFPEAKFEPNGYFRKRDWFKSTPAIFLICQKTDKPPQSVLYRTALEWALQVTRTPIIRTPFGSEYYSGLRAYEAWSEWMQRDQDFPDDLNVLGERKMVHYDAMCMVAERGDHAAAFLREIAVCEPNITEALNAAAECYEKTKSALGVLHKATGGFMATREQLRNMLPTEVRNTIAEAILKARDCDAKAADFIEQALKT